MYPDLALQWESLTKRILARLGGCLREIVMLVFSLDAHNVERSAGLLHMIYSMYCRGDNTKRREASSTL